MWNCEFTKKRAENEEKKRKTHTLCLIRENLIQAFFEAPAFAAQTDFPAVERFIYL